ncbi:ParB N-terminal domain-containing protein [Vibrio sp. RW]|uniref:ParB N-terminal domain-containing protein n=1 Tax=Vibrio sp. RW TaxID=2998833 RepID=UPI0022CD6CDD|nr:ParB N-terminal domain-containing protein [Vibrio sp. RW]MDA0146603.1 ParB N-terminal domain-containing protein [Vibrio sp. RW]
MSGKMGYGNSNNRRRSIKPGDKPSKVEPAVISDETKEAMDEAAKGGSNVFELEVDGNQVLFNLYLIKHEDIESKTFVSTENVRNQEIVNRLSLKGMIDEIKENGQLSPGISVIDPDTGKFEVIEGSQRRAGCIFNGLGFLTWGTEEKIVKESKKGISESGNYFKPKSLYEYGFEWKRLADEEGLNISQIAQLEDKHRSIIRAGINVHSLPKAVLTAIPSIPDLGRPLIESLVKKTTGLSEEQLSKLSTFCDSLSKEKDDLINTADSGAVANQQVIKKIIGFEFSAPETNSDNDSTPAPISVKKKLNDGSQVKWKQDAHQKTVSLQIDQFGDEQLEELKTLLAKWGVEL